MKKFIGFAIILIAFSSCQQIRKEDCMRFTRDVAGKCLRMKAKGGMKMGLPMATTSTTPTTSLTEHFEDPSLRMVW
jgi:hypothetical protein